MARSTRPTVGICKRCATKARATSRRIAASPAAPKTVNLAVHRMSLRPPHVALATFCIANSTQGFYVSGTCRACGRKGRYPCRWGCDPGLGIRNGLCDICGGDFQPQCDNGCNPGLGLVHGLCRQCGNVGQVPCDNGCDRGLGLKNGRCSACGASGQPPCDSGCGPGTTLINGVCVLCGYNGQPLPQWLRLSDESRPWCMSVLRRQWTSAMRLWVQWRTNHKKRCLRNSRTATPGHLC